MARTSIFQALRMREEPQESAPVVRPYQANYANKLRIIGWYFDQHNHRAVNIMEVPGGMLARVMPRHGTDDELVEFPDTAFPDLYAEVTAAQVDPGDSLRIKSDLIPTSYEDVLWALGSRLDGWVARSILIAECRQCLFVSGMRLENNSMSSRYVDFQEVLYPVDVDLLITENQRLRSGHL